MQYILTVLIALAFTFPSLAQEVEEKAPTTVEECTETLTQFLFPTQEMAREFCQCVEDEKTAHPMDASKGAVLAGPSGMDNAGPWPNIFNNCMSGPSEDTNNNE